MVYGKNAKVGNITVFSREGAINAFKAFASRCYNELTLESSVVLSDVTLDMFALGFTPDEVEALEISAIS